MTQTVTVQHGILQHFTVECIWSSLPRRRAKELGASARLLIERKGEAEMCLPKKGTELSAQDHGQSSFSGTTCCWGTGRPVPLISHLKPFESGTRLTSLQPTWPFSCSRWEHCLVKALICSLAGQLLSVGGAQAPCYSQW